MRTKFSRCLTTLVVFALIALTIGLYPGTASAQTCMQDEYDAVNGTTKSLGCTAGDVSVAAVLSNSVSVFQGGTGDKCLAGGKFSFTATFEIKTTSNKTRSNIGIFFGTGQNSALTGTCTQAILTPMHPCGFVNGVATASCGDTNYEELDGPINGEVTNSNEAGCGDTSSSDNSIFGASTQAATLEVDNVTCPTSGNSIQLPVCTNWFQPTSTMPVCESPAPNYPWVTAAIAGTSSKCTCGSLTIPVQPITPSVSVAKSCNTTSSTGSNLTSCNEGPGDVANNVTYHVNITNSTPAQEGGVVIDQICDNVYGTIYVSPSFTGKACATGTIGGNGSLISGCTPSPTDIPNGMSATCDFVAHQNENLTEADTVTVSGHSDIQTTALFGPTSSNSVTVKSSDSPSTSSITKGFVATEMACATVRYSVNIANTSGADETISLSTLSDNQYGDITKVQGNVMGTTCGVAAGVGSLSGSSGAGALTATIAPGGGYTCQFDGQFCGSILPKAEEFGTGVCSAGICSAGQVGASCGKNSDCDSTCTGISQSDIVTGTITGDESETVSQTVTGLNVTQCLASYTSPH